MRAAKRKRSRTLVDLMRAREAVYEAQRFEVAVMKSAIPLGTTVYYSHGSNSIKATVDGHSDYAARIWVVGASGKRYDICASRVLSVQFFPGGRPR